MPQVELNELERRVLGVLIEKSLAQPSYYPMTLNAVIAACNQKSNRDPVMELTRIPSGTRSTPCEPRPRLSHSGRHGRARGPLSARGQNRSTGKSAAGRHDRTAAARPTDTGRAAVTLHALYPFENAEAIAAVVQMLCETDPPLVAPLPRAPGQSAVRYAHCLYAPGERPAVAAQPLASEPASRAFAAQSSADSSPPASLPDACASEPQQQSTADDSRLQVIEEELSALREAITDLQKRLAALEQQLL